MVPKITTEKLLLVAGAVWLIAGLNIVGIGIQSSRGVWTLSTVLIAFTVFFLFHLIVFNKLVRKHVARIRDYPDQRTSVFKFFDGKSYLIMIFMMTFGILLRLSGWVPTLAIAVFYTGLGAALVAAGIAFVGSYFLKDCCGVCAS